jgi:HK97 family phage prohead protease
LIRKFAAAVVRQVGERSCRVRMATRALGRDNLVVEPTGIDITHYRRNPVVLWSHAPEAPVGRAMIFDQRADALEGQVDFAPAGVSDIADQVCGLVKAGVINAVSIGFQPLGQEPVDPHDRRAGTRITRAELLELSFVAVPADKGAIVLERSFGPARDAAALAVRRWVVGRESSAPLSRARRRADLELLSPALRSAAVARLIPRPPMWNGGSLARWAAEKRKFIELEALGRFALLPAPNIARLSFVDRQRQVAALTR